MYAQNTANLTTDRAAKTANRVSDLPFPFVLRQSGKEE
jgi:hypothetical protein